MTPTEILQKAFNDGVKISANGNHKLKLSGLPDVIGKWIPVIKNHKNHIVRLLQNHSTIIPKQDKVKKLTGNAWIDNNRDILEIAGFTDKDLFYDGWQKGILHLSLWNKPGLSVELEGSTIYFTWHNGHDTIQQSCRPEERLQ